jgi:hypothetical protein
MDQAAFFGLRVFRSEAAARGQSCARQGRGASRSGHDPASPRARSGVGPALRRDVPSQRQPRRFVCETSSSVAASGKNSARRPPPRSGVQRGQLFSGETQQRHGFVLRRTGVKGGRPTLADKQVVPQFEFRLGGIARLQGSPREGPAKSRHSGCESGLHFTAQIWQSSKSHQTTAMGGLLPFNVQQGVCGHHLARLTKPTLCSRVAGFSGLSKLLAKDIDAGPWAAHLQTH